VAIIGAGFGGIAAAVNLRKRTHADFVIFENAAGVGGTWWHNRYPGCEVDVHSHAYSFSFARYDWPRTHATQPELLRYAEDIVDLFGLRPHLRLDIGLAEAGAEVPGAVVGPHMLQAEPVIFAQPRPRLGGPVEARFGAFWMLAGAGAGPW